MSNQRVTPKSDTDVGQRIRALRRSQGRTQKDIAQAIGITSAQLHRYETGASQIATSRLIAIAQALGVGADELISAGRNMGPSSATSSQPVPGGGDDMIELIELFSRIADPRHRMVVMTVARMMAAHRQSGMPEES